MTDIQEDGELLMVWTDGNGSILVKSFYSYHMGALGNFIFIKENLLTRVPIKGVFLCTDDN